MIPISSGWIVSGGASGFLGIELEEPGWELQLAIKANKNKRYAE
tara:strand:+ start:2198 stop:2329 length:132 start_codon:yes stop_codon:yes gene_type:complete